MPPAAVRPLRQGPRPVRARRRTGCCSSRPTGFSAFDVVLPTEIPDKGRVLTGLSRFWFSETGRSSRTTSWTDADVRRIGPAARPASPPTPPRAARPDDALPPRRRPADRGHRPRLPRRIAAGRTTSDTGAVCGIALPAGLRESDRLPEPLFTPVDEGRGRPRREHRLRRRWPRSSARTWPSASATSRSRSTGFGRGRRAERPGSSWPTRSSSSGLERETGELLLIDEVLTPDSSRFWDAADYEPGRAAGQLRQAVRPRLARDAAVGQDAARARAAGRLVGGTRARYVEAFERITGASFEHYLAGGRERPEQLPVRRQRRARRTASSTRRAGRSRAASATSGSRASARPGRAARRADGRGRDEAAARAVVERLAAELLVEPADRALRGRGARAASSAVAAGRGG